MQTLDGKNDHEFQVSWLENSQFAGWLKPGAGPSLGFCMICKAHIDVSERGIVDVLEHAAAKKHQKRGKLARKRAAKNPLPTNSAPAPIPKVIKLDEDVDLANPEEGTSGYDYYVVQRSEDCYDEDHEALKARLEKYLQANKDVLKKCGDDDHVTSVMLEVNEEVTEEVPQETMGGVDEEEALEQIDAVRCRTTDVIVLRGVISLPSQSKCLDDIYLNYSDNEEGKDEDDPYNTLHKDFRPVPPSSFTKGHPPITRTVKQHYTPFGAAQVRQMSRTEKNEIRMKCREKRRLQKQRRRNNQL